MKIILLQGDDLSSIKTRLILFKNEALKRNWSIEDFSFNDPKTKIEEILLADNLFTKDKLVIASGSEKMRKQDIEFLVSKSKALALTLVLVCDGVLPQRLLEKLGDEITKENYTLPKLIFKFLDSFYPGNTRECLRLFHKVINLEPVEFVFHLLAKQLRDIYWVRFSPSDIPYPSWKVSKLEELSSRFKDGQLEKIIDKLAQIDISVKKGQTDLASSLDLVISTWLE